MATSFTFNNQIVKLPGSYSRFVSGVTNPPLALSFGNILLIDTGSGVGYGAGAGISGELASDMDAIYDVDNITEFRNAIGGGILWDIATNLFQPNGAGGGNGVSKIFYARAATTIAASATMTFTGGGSNGGEITIKAKNEGTVGNGVLYGTDDKLVQGYAIEMLAGVDDTSKFLIKIWRGGYKGLDPNGYVWDEVPEDETIESLIATSPEFDNISDLISWMQSDTKFGSSFHLSSNTVTGDGSVDAADLANYADYTLFAGGTTTYNTDLVDKVLEYVQNKDYSLVLCDQYGDDAQSVDNGKILAHISDGETFGDKLMVVGGGADKNKFGSGETNSSVDTAQYYNNDRVIVAHGSPIKTTDLVADGFIDQTPLHKAASVCGRLAGLQPQIPITFKTLRIDGEKHKLSIKEKKQGLKYGVLMTEADNSLFRCVQGVNTIQNNDFLINRNGTTHSIQLRRMMAQVNKELVVNATEQLLKNPDGTNRNTLSAAAVKAFTETYLKGRTATVTEDNMIISFKNVVVLLDNDAYKVTYDVVFNTEITKLFFTGTVFLNF